MCGSRRLVSSLTLLRMASRQSLTSASLLPAVGLTRSSLIRRQSYGVHEATSVLSMCPAVPREPVDNFRGGVLKS